MCRTTDSSGIELPACIGCKTACPDIDLEKSYWTELMKPGRRFAQYGYLGLVIGFFCYFGLYSGNWDYYKSGIWTHEQDLIGQLFYPGFYVFGYAVPIPKLVAVPLTLAFFTLATYLIGIKLEKKYCYFLFHRGKRNFTKLALHRLYCIYTFLAFNIFYGFAGRPNLFLLPRPIVFLLDIAAILVSVIWLVRSLNRRPRPSKVISASKFSLQTLKGYCGKNMPS
jgi:hypothetical protein